MLFYSPHANMQVICSKTRQVRHPVTGDVIETVPGIWANFGKLGPQFEYMDPLTGETAQGAEITGHYFDSDLEAAQNGWDQDTKEMVERAILKVVQREPARIQVIEREVARVPAPWPSYDEMEPEDVVEFASRLGLVAETIAYERENRSRPFVLDGLAASQDAETELATAAPEAEPDPAGARGRTITV